MFCNKCESKAYEDSVFCHRCGALIIRDEKRADMSGIAPKVDTGNNTKFDTEFPEFATEDDSEVSANFDIVLVDVANIETGADKKLSDRARMAVAYVLFEDMIKNVNRDVEPDLNLKNRLQNESMRNADILISNLPATIKRSVSKSEAVFFKERLAQYGVTVILGYCPNCGGSLDEISDKCITCGHAAIEFEVTENNITIPDAHMPKQATKHTEANPAPTATQTPKETDNLQAQTPPLPDDREIAKEKRKNKIIAILASALATLIIAAVILWYLT